MTLIAVPIMVDSLEQALACAARAAEQGADLVEFRIDRFTDDPDAVTQLVQRSSLPCLVTCRPTWEGGEYDGDEMTRVSLLEHAGLGARQPAYIDVELAAYQRSANLRQKVNLVVDHAHQPRAVTTGLILSSHDFATRPADLQRRLLDMLEQPACRVVKLAWQARSLRDNLEAFEIIARRHKPTIALCMGEAGLPSRVLAGKFGSLLTFASLQADSATAPGQPTVAQLKNLYRWDRLTPETRVYGVIGHPVGHSLSPAIHNAGFDATGFDGVYLPMPIPPEYEHFKATVGAWLDMDALHFSGASVTIPHKENLLRFVRERGGAIEPLSERIGAANTLARRADGSLYACNTDYAAALDAVCAALGIERDALAGRRVALLGAGGAARAVAAGFAHYGATVVIYNRTLAKAEHLVDALSGDGKATCGKIVAASMDMLCRTCCEIIINCTPLGMHPQVEGCPLDDTMLKQLGPSHLVFDTIYNPARTHLLACAQAAGARTVSGVEMFVRQAVGQFELWTGQPAPAEVFRTVVMQSLEH